MSLPTALQTRKVEVCVGPGKGNVDFHLYEPYTLGTTPKVLGSGTFGCVIAAVGTEKKGAFRSSGNGCLPQQSVAIKKLSGVLDEQCPTQSTKGALREICVLKHFSHHDHILALQDMIIPLQRNWSEAYPVGKLPLGDVYLVTEKMDYDLDHIIRHRKGKQFKSEERKVVLCQILRGLYHIHSAGVIHRDMKPSNILVNRGWHVKICDFGSARKQAYEMTRNVTTQRYRPPEILLQMAKEENPESASTGSSSSSFTSHYDFSADVWGVGCILAELLKLTPMFHGAYGVSSQLLAIIQTLGFPHSSFNAQLKADIAVCIGKGLLPPEKNWKEEIFASCKQFTDDSEVDLLRRMLHLDSQERISVVNAAEHAFLADYHDPDLMKPCAPFEFKYEEEQQGGKSPVVALLEEFAYFHPEIQQLLSKCKSV